jgi:hypothetical protein
VVLGDVVGVKARSLVSFDQLEPRLVKLVQWQIVPIQMVEDAVFHITPDIS